jgi:methylase of polypeptide subunit release factors
MFDSSLPASQAALLALGKFLQQQDYRHVCTTPATHQRLLQRRAGQSSTNLADAFGWNLPFSAELLPAALSASLRSTGAVSKHEELLLSNVRFSTLQLGEASGLFCHSAFPTQQTDAVFFGPDSYRFAAAIGRALADPLSTMKPRTRAVELCAGAGPGAWAIAQCLHPAPLAELLLADLNPKALACAAVNFQLNARPAGAAAPETALRFAQGDLFGDASGSVDVIVANPPYLLDAARRTYRHGGETLGTDLAVRIVKESLPRLTATGCLVLYTGAPMVRGRDVLRQALQPLLQQAGFSSTYEEIDPDVFGEELEQPAYAQVERIAAVSVVVRRSSGA